MCLPHTHARTHPKEQPSSTTATAASTHSMYSHTLRHEAERQEQENSELSYRGMEGEGRLRTI